MPELQKILDIHHHCLPFDMFVSQMNRFSVCCHPSFDYKALVAVPLLFSLLFQSTENLFYASQIAGPMDKRA